MWSPEPSEELESALQEALTRPRASRVVPCRPVACSDGRTGWIWGRLQLDDGSWCGLATLQAGPFDPPELGWHRASELRVLA